MKNPTRFTKIIAVNICMLFLLSNIAWAVPNCDTRHTTQDTCKTHAVRAHSQMDPEGTPQFKEALEAHPDKKAALKIAKNAAATIVVVFLIIGIIQFASYLLNSPPDFITALPDGTSHAEAANVLNEIVNEGLFPEKTAEIHNLVSALGDMPDKVDVFALGAQETADKVAKLAMSTTILGTLETGSIQSKKEKLARIKELIQQKNEAMLYVFERVLSSKEIAILTMRMGLEPYAAKLTQKDIAYIMGVTDAKMISVKENRALRRIERWMDMQTGEFSEDSIPGGKKDPLAIRIKVSGLAPRTKHVLGSMEIHTFADFMDAVNNNNGKKISKSNISVSFDYLLQRCDMLYAWSASESLDAQLSELDESIDTINGFENNYLINKLKENGIETKKQLVELFKKYKRDDIEDIHLDLKNWKAIEYMLLTEGLFIKYQSAATAEEDGVAVKGYAYESQVGQQRNIIKNKRVEVISTKASQSTVKIKGRVQILKAGDHRKEIIKAGDIKEGDILVLYEPLGNYDFYAEAFKRAGAVVLGRGAMGYPGGDEEEMMRLLMEQVKGEANIINANDLFAFDKNVSDLAGGEAELIIDTGNIEGNKFLLNVGEVCEKLISEAKQAVKDLRKEVKGLNKVSGKKNTKLEIYNLTNRLVYALGRLDRERFAGTFKQIREFAALYDDAPKSEKLDANSIGKMIKLIDAVEETVNIVTKKISADETSNKAQAEKQLGRQTQALKRLMQEFFPEGKIGVPTKVPVYSDPMVADTSNSFFRSLQNVEIAAAPLLAKLDDSDEVRVQFMKQASLCARAYYILDFLAYFHGVAKNTSMTGHIGGRGKGDTIWINNTYPYVQGNLERAIDSILRVYINENPQLNELKMRKNIAVEIENIIRKYIDKRKGQEDASGANFSLQSYEALAFGMEGLEKSVFEKIKEEQPAVDGEKTVGVGPRGEASITGNLTAKEHERLNKEIIEERAWENVDEDMTKWINEDMPDEGLKSFMRHIIKQFNEMGYVGTYSGKLITRIEVCSKKNLARKYGAAATWGNTEGRIYYDPEVKAKLMQKYGDETFVNMLLLHTLMHDAEELSIIYAVGMNDGTLNGRYGEMISGQYRPESMGLVDVMAPDEIKQWLDAPENAEAAALLIDKAHKLTKHKVPEEVIAVVKELREEYVATLSDEEREFEEDKETIENAMEKLKDFYNEFFSPGVIDEWKYVDLDSEEPNYYERKVKSDYEKAVDIYFDAREAAEDIYLIANKWSTKKPFDKDIKEFLLQAESAKKVTAEKQWRSHEPLILKSPFLFSYKRFENAYVRCTGISARGTAGTVQSEKDRLQARLDVLKSELANLKSDQYLQHFSGAYTQVHADRFASLIDQKRIAIEAVNNQIEELENSQTETVQQADGIKRRGVANPEPQSSNVYTVRVNNKNGEIALTDTGSGKEMVFTDKKLAKKLKGIDQITGKDLLNTLGNLIYEDRLKWTTPMLSFWKRVPENIKITISGADKDVIENRMVVTPDMMKAINDSLNQDDTNTEFLFIAEEGQRNLLKQFGVPESMIKSDKDKLKGYEIRVDLDAEEISLVGNNQKIVFPAVIEDGEVLDLPGLVDSVMVMVLNAYYTGVTVDEFNHRLMNRFRTDYPFGMPIGAKEIRNRIELYQILMNKI